jgi:hypothetical protein
MLGARATRVRNSAVVLDGRVKGQTRKYSMENKCRRRKLIRKGHESDPKYSKVLSKTAIEP